MPTNIVIAIDGYSSCGKSTIAKALAKKLHFLYIDSGAMYRAVTLYLLRNKVSFADVAAVQASLATIQLTFDVKNEEACILLNGEDVSKEIRQMHVAEKVSQASALKVVRTEMVKQQQRLGKSENIVMDGRDIGTAVFPNAQLKLFMTADPHVRAQRRYKELSAKGDKVTLDEIFKNLTLRDHQDTTREESPLVRAEDAIILDNTNLSENEQLEFVLEKVSPFLTPEQGTS